MTPLRRAAWLAVGLAFAAGLAVGLAVPALCAAGQAPATEDEQVVERFATRYGLDAEQRRKLAIVLHHRRQVREQVMRRYSEKLPVDLTAELRREMQHAEDLIMALLNEEQLARYRRDALAGTTTLGETRHR